MCAATDDLPCRALLLSIGTCGDTTTSLLLLSSLDWHKQKKIAVLSVCARVVIALKRKSKKAITVWLLLALKPNKIEASEYIADGYRSSGFFSKSEANYVKCSLLAS